jgi:hypothetical protein
MIAAGITGSSGNPLLPDSQFGPETESALRFLQSGSYDRPEDNLLDAAVNKDDSFISDDITNKVIGGGKNIASLYPGVSPLVGQGIVPDVLEKPFELMLGKEGWADAKAGVKKDVKSALGAIIGEGQDFLEGHGNIYEGLKKGGDWAVDKIGKGDKTKLLKDIGVVPHPMEQSSEFVDDDPYEGLSIDDTYGPPPGQTDYEPGVSEDIDPIMQDPNFQKRFKDLFGDDVWKNTMLGNR